MKHEGNNTAFSRACFKAANAESPIIIRFKFFFYILIFFYYITILKSIYLHNYFINILRFFDQKQHVE